MICFLTHSVIHGINLSKTKLVSVKSLQSNLSVIQAVTQSPWRIAVHQRNLPTIVLFRRMYLAYYRKRPPHPCANTVCVI